jgi:hypothetical protein
MTHPSLVSLKTVSHSVMTFWGQTRERSASKDGAAAMTPSGNGSARTMHRGIICLSACHLLGLREVLITAR